MGKKRRRIRNDGQVRQSATRQVVARNVNTTVVPGSQGMPVQPDPIALPTPPQETDINVDDLAAQRDFRNSVQESQRLIQGFGSLSAGLNQMAQGAVKLGVTMKSQEELTLDYQIKERERLRDEMEIENLSFAQRVEQGLIPETANPNYMRALSEYELVRTERTMKDWYNSNRAEIEADPKSHTLSGFQDIFEERFQTQMQSMPESGDRAWYEQGMEKLKKGMWSSLSSRHASHVDRMAKEKFGHFVTAKVDDILDSTMLTGDSVDEMVANMGASLEQLIYEGYAKTRTPGAMQTAVGRELINIMAKGSSVKARRAAAIFDKMPAGGDSAPNSFLKNITEVKAYRVKMGPDIEANTKKQSTISASGFLKEATKFSASISTEAVHTAIFKSGFGGLTWDADEPALAFTPQTFSNDEDFRNNIAENLTQFYADNTDIEGVSVQFTGHTDQNREKLEFTVVGNPELIGKDNTIVVDLKRAVNDAKRIQFDSYVSGMADVFPEMDIDEHEATAAKLLSMDAPQLIQESKEAVLVFNDALSNKKLDPEVEQELSAKFYSLYKSWKTHSGINPLGTSSVLSKANSALIELFEDYDAALLDLTIGVGNDEAGRFEAYRTVMGKYRTIVDNPGIEKTFNNYLASFIKSGSAEDTSLLNQAHLRDNLFLEFAKDSTMTEEIFNRRARGVITRFKQDHHAVGGRSIHASDLPGVVGDAGGSVLPTLQGLLGKEDASEGTALQAFTQGLINPKSTLGKKANKMLTQYAKRNEGSVPSGYFWKASAMTANSWELHAESELGLSGIMGTFNLMEIMEMGRAARGRNVEGSRPFIVTSNAAGRLRDQPGDIIPMADPSMVYPKSQEGMTPEQRTLPQP